MEKPFPAYNGEDPYIFVCYAHDDEDVVYPEMAWLHEQGIKVWYDEGISAGRVWRAEIAQAIDACSSLLYYVSKSSLDSVHCNREINLALDQDKTILPVYLEAVELTDDLRIGLSRVQALHRDQDASYQQHLLNALGQTIENAPRSPSLKQKLPSSVREKRSSVPAIAVLPFVNIGDTEDYFSDGVTDEILNRMIRLRDVRVISRNSSFAFRDSALDIREIGKALGADYILQGSLRRSGDTVRIGVRLTDTADGTEMWGSSYDRELTDILRLQDEIAQAAISEFVPNITIEPSARPDVDPVAYDLYLRAGRALAANDTSGAKPLLESAIAIDSDFAGAYGALSVAYYYADDDRLLRVLKKALDLDPDDIAALSTEATIKFYREFDLQGSISAFESLIRRFPSSRVHYWYAEVLTAALKMEEMRLVSERIQMLDPHSTGSAIAEFNAHYEVGEFDRARRALDRIPLDPVGEAPWSGRRRFLIKLEIATGQWEAAEDLLRSLKQQYVGAAFGDPKVTEVWLALERGQLDVARKLSESLPETMTNQAIYWMPLDVVLTGDTSRTLDEIENPRSVSTFTWVMNLQRRDRWISQYGAPVFQDAFAALRREPRYQQALRKYGIDDESLAKIEVHTDELWD